MKNTTLLCTALMTGLLHTTAIHAQDYWSPFGSPSGSLIYDSSTGQLSIPALTVRANRFEPGTLMFDVVLAHEGNETFRVVSSRGLQPDEECTRAEVLAVIPQLRLDMTVAEAEALIGCKAVINPRETDLVLGRRVEVSWKGQDGAPNLGATGNAVTNFNFTELPATWVAVTGPATSPSGVPYLVTSSGGPAIVLSLREGVVESYTYTLEPTSRECQTESLDGGFGLLEEGDSLMEIEAKLQCEGALLQTTVGAAQTIQSLSWQSRSRPLFTSIPAELENHRIEVVLANDALKQATKTSTTVQYLPSPCTIEHILTMADAIEVGMSESAMLAESTCPTNFANSVETHSSSTANYHWSSQNTSESIYVSVNRSLTVSVRDGAVRAVSLRRQ